MLTIIMHYKSNLIQKSSKGLRLGRCIFENFQYFFVTECNLDLVTLLVSAKTVTKLPNVTKSNDYM